MQLFRFCLVLLLLMFSTLLKAQDKTVEIRNADLMRSVRTSEGEVKHLVGNVIMQQNDVTLWCDSAILDNDKNNVNAFGNIKIKQGDSITLYCKELNYFGNEKKLIAKQKVRLEKSKSTLLTDELNYDTKTKTGWYLNGGKLLNDSTILISKIGYYHAKNGDAFFKEKVKLTDPRYRLTADSFMYNVNTKINYFTGATNISNDSSKIYCEGGHYNLNTGDSRFIIHAHVISKTQNVSADRIDFNSKTSVGAAFGNVKFVDSVQKINVYGGEIHFIQNKKYLKAFIHPILQTLLDKDTLYINADTLISFTLTHDSILKKDSIKNQQLLLAYYHVRMFSRKLQAVCDSSVYNTSDSAFHLFYQPVLWIDSNQLSADTINIFTKQNKMDKLELLQKSLVIERLKRKLFNQIAGRKTIGYFKNNELDKMYVEGNAESVYYSVDSKKAFTGVNRSNTGRMRFEFKEGKMDKIFFYEQPDATFYPMHHLDFKKINLKSFKWLGNLKPTFAEFKPFVA